MILNINSDMLKKLTATEKVVVDYINKNEKFLANKYLIELSKTSDNITINDILISSFNIDYKII